MQQVVFLLLGAHLANAGTHSLQYFYTAVSGDIDFPDFTVIGLVDGRQFMYFDSNINKAVPKTDWMRQNVEADYWEKETQTDKGLHQAYKNNIKTLKERFNQSNGVHTFQKMYGCEWDHQTGTEEGFSQFGYDGEDLIHLDLKELRYISPVQEGFITVLKWNNDRSLNEHNKNYFKTVCIEWLKKYLRYGKSHLEKTVSPQVSLLQKSSSSPVSCHVTGFYPSGIKISWQRNGQDHDENVELGELLPNADGTFQKTSTLNIKPEEWKNNKFICVVEHQGETKTKTVISTNNASVLIGFVVGFTAVQLVIISIGVFLLYQKKKAFDSVAEKNKNQIYMNSVIDPGYGSKSDKSSHGTSDVTSVCSDSSSDSTTALILKTKMINEKPKTDKVCTEIGKLISMDQSK